LPDGGELDILRASGVFTGFESRVLTVVYRLVRGGVAGMSSRTGADDRQTRAGGIQRVTCDPGLDFGRDGALLINRGADQRGKCVPPSVVVAIMKSTHKKTSGGLFFI
jgi:hypothetical protein